MIKLIFLLLVFIPIVIICLLFLFPSEHKVLSLLGANTLLFLSITLLFFYLSDYEVAVTTTQTSRSFFENGALYLIEFKYFGYYIFDISFLAFVFGFDFLNINLVILMNFIFLISFYYNIYTIKSHNYIFSILLFSLSTILVLLFCTFNIFLFYLLFEISLLPLFFIIGIWGNRERKIHAAMLFLIYTSVFSIFFLFSLLNIFYWFGTFNFFLILKYLSSTYLYEKSAIYLLICWCFLLIAFLSKLPLFPFHIWLPEAHVEAPTVGSVILASILLKVGGYAIFRFLMPIYSIWFSSFHNQQILSFYIILIWISLLYSTIMAFSQVDFKKIIAYSSIVHMSLGLIGLFSFSTQGIRGFYLMLFGHAFVSAALFFIAGMLYNRFGTRLLKYYSGISIVAPNLAFFSFFFIIANIGFPGSINFLCELFILVGIVSVYNFFFISFFGICFCYSLLYSIWLYNKIFLGTFNNAVFYYYYDLQPYEFNILMSLFCPTIIFGFFPNLIL